MFIYFDEAFRVQGSEGLWWELNLVYYMWMLSNFTIVQSWIFVRFPRSLSSFQRSSSTSFVFSTRTLTVGGRSPSPSPPSRWAETRFWLSVFKSLWGCWRVCAPAGSRQAIRPCCPEESRHRPQQESWRTHWGWGMTSQLIQVCEKMQCWKSVMMVLRFSWKVERVVTIMQNPRQYKIPDWFLNRQKDIKDGKYSQVWDVCCISAPCHKNTDLIL